MKRIWNFVYKHTKDLIALMVIFTWCVAVFLPESLIDEVTQRSFERIILMVIGFYFGSNVNRKEELQ